MGERNARGRSPGGMPGGTARSAGFEPAGGACTPQEAARPTGAETTGYRYRNNTGGRDATADCSYKSTSYGILARFSREFSCVLAGVLMRG